MSKSHNNVNPWLTYSLLGVVGILIVFVATVFYQHQNDRSVAENKISGEVNKKSLENESTEVLDDESVKKKYFPKTEPMTIASMSVEASVAVTWSERIKGLSDTPYLPANIVKFFVFDTNGFHAIWMKDMNYPIDIIWVDENNLIVDLKENADPSSFPEVFTPKTEAIYVIETEAGFVEKHSIKVGQEVTLPKF